MGIIGKDYKFKLIRNYVSQETLNILTNYCFIKHQNNQSNFEPSNDNFVTWQYVDPIMESIMGYKLTTLEKETGLNLIPTYTVWRAYTYGNHLPKHKDRAACEISVTLNIGSDKPWPIFMDGKCFTLNQGDAVVYLGREVEHWREPYDGDYSFNVFMHYVNAEGPCAHWAFDKRKFFGEQTDGRQWEGQDKSK